MTLPNGVQEAVEVVDIDICGHPQFLDPAQEIGMSDRKSSVGSKGRKHPSRQICLRDPSMMLEVLRRIIGGAQGFDRELLENALGGEIACQRGIGLLPNSGGGLLVQKVADSEIALQFQMGPLIKRIT